MNAPQGRRPIIVQKFGGTSVGTIERIQHVARWALDTQARGNSVVLVVSAMSGETNRLVALAQQINPIPFSRDYDVVLASGEQVVVGLLSLAINTEAEKRGLVQRGVARARPFLGHQVGIRTDNIYSKARIEEINTDSIEAELRASVIPVIAGFQGVDSEGNITTLGRGGSDTSAVAIAAALEADECEIYTDVDGVYTTDPRLCPRAKKMDQISYEEMMELANLGAKVLHVRSVELAAKYKVPLQVRSSFDAVEGTRVVMSNSKMEEVMVAGIAADLAQVKLTLQDLPNRPGIAAMVFGILAEEAVVVDIIVQDQPAAGKLTLSFTVGEADALKAKMVLGGKVKQEFPEMKILEEGRLAKVSAVGVGMQHHPGVAAKMFSLLAQAGVDIKLITTSEIKISCLVAADQAKNAVDALHRGFGLG